MHVISHSIWYTEFGGRLDNVMEKKGTVLTRYKTEDKKKEKLSFVPKL
jgi:hypothetical protein